MSLLVHHKKSLFLESVLDIETLRSAPGHLERRILSDNKHVPTQVFSLNYLSNANLWFVFFFIHSENCAVQQLALPQ